MPMYKVVAYETSTQRVTYEVEAENEQDAKEHYWEGELVGEKDCDGESEVDSITLLKESEVA